MQIIKIKPLSVNESYRGRRFKTNKYKSYEQELLLILPRMKLPEGFLSVSIEWGFSNSASDIDNPAKPFIDVLQKKYGFNDRVIKELSLKAFDVKKGDEYIKFDIRSLEQ